MIKFIQGDMFKTQCSAIVNPCNCVGVGGKGISLFLRRNAPSNFISYCELCKLGILKPGKCAVVETSELGPDIKYIINFPTKNDWREGSKMDYIRKGIGDLIESMKSLGIQSVAIPALGCGCGGLAWDKVKTSIIEIIEYLGHDDLTIEVYEPLEV